MKGSALTIMLTKQPHHIIAIGASAGGLEEINSFFDHTPMDGVSYIIIQHLSPDFKSRMVELLARHSKLLVKEAQNDMLVISNEVYLIPNDKFMIIRDDKLFLSEKDQGQGPNLTINRFFNSLAVNSGNKAIAVVLSGLGSDGSEGIVAIKSSGGMVIARDPETSAFGSMPSNAIATGDVDYILEPAAMPGIIESYLKNEGTIQLNIEKENKILEDIIKLIKEQSPLDFTDYKQSTIFRRIKRRASFNNFINLESYLQYLREVPEEIEILVKDFLISVTAFFRDKEAFKFLGTDVIPKVFKSIVPGEEFKIWVAGCATGEEAYSLAILIAEHKSVKFNDVVVKIFATDIDSVALIHAGKGIYPESITKDVSEERLEKYFSKEEDNYRVKPEIRNMVIFGHHDLVKNPPYCNMQIITCRNLLIYMAPVLQKKIFGMLLFGLKMKGYLFLGASESPMPIIQNLEVVNKKWKIYKNLEAKRSVHLDGFLLPQMIDIKGKRPLTAQEEFSQNSNHTLAEAINEALVTNLDVLSICIDQNNQVIKTYGDTTKYLIQRNFNPNLQELLPRPLAEVFNSLTMEVAKSKKKQTVNRIESKYGDNILYINMSITNVYLKNTEKQLLLVTLSEDKGENVSVQQHIYDEKKYHDQYTLMIEEELNDLKDKLSTTYEQLDASNDNMQSFNEELLSANEEMQSTNEEMQSVNEELHTINADYQLKNKELQEVNDDLDNYFRSNINGQLFVNRDLILMKFSPGTVKQINLLPSDVGRPLSNISTNIKLETIIEDIRLVIDEGTLITREIETMNGKWYQTMTMPYVQQMDNKISGAIVTFNDISELKKTQVELDSKNQSLQKINDDLDNFVHTASHDLLAPLGNIETSINVMNEIKVADPKLNTFLNIINSSIKKFRNLINDIASVAKIEGEMLSKEMVDLNDILNDIEWSLDNSIRNSGAVIIRDFKVSHICFSKKNIRSILFNLISNSIKFKNGTSPIINVNTIKSADQVILSVQDNGIGIAKEEHEKIFNLYGRVNPEVEGQGIGLYLARKIINAADGNLQLESEPGKGCKFIITFKPEQEHPHSIS